MSKRARYMLVVAAVYGCLVAAASGCTHKQPQYGVERPLFMAGRKQVWAVAPAVNISGVKDADPILQADVLFQQLQQVQGVTVLPVNRTAEVYAALRMDRVQNERQAQLVCDLLGCDGLVVPTITIYDPYNPPKLGASLALFLKAPPAPARKAAAEINPRDLVRQAGPIGSASGGGSTTRPQPLSEGGVLQSVGMFDAENGSVRSALQRYAEGRFDPVGPLGAKEYLVSMDRYCGFVYHVLIAELIDSPKFRRVMGGGVDGIGGAVSATASVRVKDGATDRGLRAQD